jgi:hypothetical protein
LVSDNGMLGLLRTGSKGQYFFLRERKGSVVGSRSGCAFGAALMSGLGAAQNKRESFVGGPGGRKCNNRLIPRVRGPDFFFFLCSEYKCHLEIASGIFFIW